MTKDARPSGLTMRRDAGEIQVKIDPWQLPAPQFEYFADLCDARSVASAPTLLFAQLAPDDHVVTALAVAMPGRNFKEVVASFDPVLGRLEAADLEAGHAIGEARITASWNPTNYRKFVASIIRGGVSIEGAMLDFYRLAVPVGQQLESNTVPQGLIEPCVRVFMATSTMVHLFDTIRGKGLA